MKVSMLTFSQTGNTLKVGKSIAVGLEVKRAAVLHLRYADRGDFDPQAADLIGIGSPCFENHPAECVMDFLKKGGLKLNGKKAFVYITSGGSPAKTLYRLAQAVSLTGAEIIGGIQIRGTVTVPTMFGMFPDRPNKDDLDSAHAFGAALADYMRTGKDLPDEYRIDPHEGGKLYDTIGPWLTTIKKRITPDPGWQADKCNQCGICERECPTENISLSDTSLRFSDRCIVCYRCWNICPTDAIDIVFSPGSGWLERHLYSESMERRFGNVDPEEYYGNNLYKEVLARKIKLKYSRSNPTAEFTRVRNSSPQ